MTRPREQSVRAACSSQRPGGDTSLPDKGLGDAPLIQLAFTNQYE
jgi:hypothetical protein